MKPQDEQQTLGTMMLSGNVDESVEFGDLRHYAIHHTLIAMKKTGANIDLVSVKEWLKRRNLLERVGSMNYLVTLAESVP